MTPPAPSTLSTHVLDAALGRPAVGLAVVLSGPDGAEIAAEVTDDDGRVAFDVELGTGTHHLVLETGSWFAAADRDHYHPEVAVSFVVEPASEHHHVAVLLSPYAYTTYRGS